MTNLSLDRLRELLTYNHSTGAFTWRKATNLRIVPGRIAGTPDPKGYTRIKIDGVIYKAHRLAWFYTTGEWPARQVDHINGNPADNRITNLRLATNAENGRNRGANANNLLGIKGVSWRADCNKYRAQISVNGKKRYLGYFSTAEEASAAYQAAATELHGPFAAGMELARAQS